ncbi:DUF1028 domain-containing protein [Celeribacter sp. ULVN23_4]
MTFSLLVRDPETGAIAGAAATGSLCVGGWVLRGELRSGMSASQGASPSTFWGEDVLARMRAGMTAEQAVAEITGADRNRADRQLSALGLSGAGAAFTGGNNTDAKGALAFENGIVAGNLLSDLKVLEAIRDGYLGAEGALGKRLLAGLKAGKAQGGDSRGLLSAALLILHEDRAPLTLRVDYDERDPLATLEALFERATSGEYAFWARQVPSLSDPERGLD